MSLIESFKTAWESLFRKGDAIELPADGRSSRETLGGAMSMYLNQFSTVSPIIDFEALKTLKLLWLFNPDFSQYVANIVNLGNPGHALTVDAGSDSVAEAAVERLNESASRIYTHGCGIDGLINQYLTSIAWSGAISSEDVVNIAAGRVEKVVLVPVEQIRFKFNKDLDRYEAYQRTNGLFTRRDGVSDPSGLVRLNDETYKYFALSTVENSPYAKPPATAAIDAILKGQLPIMENLQYMAKKYGLMGLIAVSVVPPNKRPTETEGEHAARATSYLKNVRDRIAEFKNGIITTFRDQKVEHTPIATSASDIYDINRISEEQVFSGLHAMPGFHGRTDSTTETFADVVYYLLTAQVAGMQRLAKRRQEQTYRLDLRLGGIDVDGVSLTFNKAHSRNALAEAQTEQTKFTDVLARIKSGAISPDEGAQELGYDQWEDPELLFTQTGIAPVQSNARSFTRDKTRMKLTLQFDQRSQKYRHQPEAIEIWSGNEVGHADNVVPIKKKAQLA